MRDPHRVLNDDSVPWLLEVDAHNPGVRYFTLRNLMDRPEDDLEVRAARAEIMTTGPVPAILAEQDPAMADYSPAGRVSSTWLKFGFHLSYWSDVLQLAEVLVAVGLGSDPRLGRAIT